MPPFHSVRFANGMETECDYLFSMSDIYLQKIYRIPHLLSVSLTTCFKTGFRIYFLTAKECLETFELFSTLETKIIFIYS